MSDEIVSAPAPELDGLNARKKQLEAKLQKDAVNNDPIVKARTEKYLAEVNAAIAAAGSPTK